jgi:hypothetical protein
VRTAVAAAERDGAAGRGRRERPFEKDNRSMKTQASLPSPRQFVLSPTSDQAEEAYDRVRPKLDAVDDNDLGRSRVNVALATLIMLGALPNLEALRQQIEGLSGQAPDLIDHLREYTYALIHVQAMSVLTSENEAHTRTLATEAMPLRNRLLSAAELYVKYGIFDADQVAAIRSGSGLADAATDLLSLARLFRAHWSKLEGKTLVTTAEVDRAGTLGIELLGALGRRRVGSDGSRTPGDLERTRARLLHLFLQAYNQTQRAVVYLRWNEGDADTVLPSIFQGRPRRRRDVDEAPSEPPAPEPSEPSEPSEQDGLDAA